MKKLSFYQAYTLIGLIGFVIVVPCLYYSLGAERSYSIDRFISIRNRICSWIMVSNAARFKEYFSLSTVYQRENITTHQAYPIGIAQQ